MSALSVSAPPAAGAGPSRLVAVGDYAGMLGRDALALITTARLMATIEPSPVEAVEQAGYVVGQEPAPGAQLRRNHMVILYVGDHPDAVLEPVAPAPSSARRRRGPVVARQPSLFDELELPAPAATPVEAAVEVPAPAPSAAPSRTRGLDPWPCHAGIATVDQTASDELDGPVLDDAPEFDKAPVFDDDEPIDAEQHAEPPTPDPVAWPPQRPAEPCQELGAGTPIVAAVEGQVAGAERDVLAPTQLHAPASQPGVAARRRRPARRLSRLRGRQGLATIGSGLVIVYLSASLLAGRASHPTAASSTSRSVASLSPTAAPAPRPLLSLTSAASRHRRRPRQPKPSRVVTRAARRVGPVAASASVPVQPSPATPVPVPASSPAPAWAAIPRRPSQAAVRSGAGVPSPLGPIGPAPNQQ